MIGLGNGLMFGGMRPIASVVSSILRSYTGSLYLPSPTSCFTDVAGTTPCAVDTTVALMLDEMRTLGSELVTNGDFSAGTTGWTQASGTISNSSNRLSVAGDGAATWGRGSQSMTVVAGKSYRVVVDVTPSVSGARIGVNYTGHASSFIEYQDVTTTRQLTFQFVATGTTAFVALSTKSATETCYFDNISVKEVTGIHATQATAGYRPTLRGAVKNLLPYSNDLTNAGYAKTNLTPTANSLTRASSASAACSRAVSIGVGALFTFQQKAKPKSVSGLFGMRVQGTYPNRVDAVFNLNTGTIVGTNASTYTLTDASISGPDANGYYLCTLSGVAVTSAVVTVLFGPTDDTLIVAGWEAASAVLSDCYCDERQVEISAVANPYVATGATVASSSYGPFVEEFDGLVTRQTLSSVPFQMSDDFFVVVACTPTDKSVARAVFSVGSTASDTPTFLMSYTTAGFPYVLWRDNAGVNDAATGAVDLLGVPHVYAVRKVGNNKYVYVNGVQVSTTKTTALGATTFNVATIGALVRTSAIQFFQGNLNAIEYGVGAITDPQFLTIQRLAGQKIGVTI